MTSHFGRRIRQRRLELKMSQESLAKNMALYYGRRAVTRTAIAQWESGVVRDITGTALLKVCAVLDVSPEWIVYGVVKK